MTKRASKWQADWKRYNMTSSGKGSSCAYCNTCGVDFAVAGGGVHEVKRHIQTKKHQDHERYEYSTKYQQLSTIK